MARAERTKITVQINNWEKYNPRRDVKTSSWFRLEHGIYDDPQFIEFSGDELSAMIYIFAMASRANKGGLVTLRLKHATQNGRIKAAAFWAVIRMLEDEEYQILHEVVTDTSRPRNALVTSTCTTDGRDETNVTNETGRDETISAQIVEVYETEFQNCFVAFRSGVEQNTGVRPIKGQHGLKRFEKEIWARGQFENFKKAIENYVGMLAAETDRTPKKSLETFIGTKQSGFYWLNWLDYEPPIASGKTYADKRFNANKAQAQRILDDKL